MDERDLKQLSKALMIVLIAVTIGLLSFMGPWVLILFFKWWSALIMLAYVVMFIAVIAQYSQNEFKSSIYLALVCLVMILVGVLGIYLLAS